MYDVAIIGGGPAGLSATINAASEGLRAVLLTDRLGGQAGDSSRIENYLGFGMGISGAELARQAWVQSRKFGAEIADRVFVSAVNPGNGLHTLTLRDGSDIQARTVILATGGQYRTLGAAQGSYVHYKATHNEKALCDDVPVMIVGGGNSSGQAATYLSEVAERVYLVTRSDSLRDSMSRYLIARLEALHNVSVIGNAEVSALQGSASLESVELADNRDGKVTRYAAHRLFIMIGSKPDTCYLPPTVCRGIGGYIAAREQYATAVPGIFAVGDVRQGSVKRVATAVGEGAAVVPAVHAYLAS